MRWRRNFGLRGTVEPSKSPGEKQFFGIERSAEYRFGSKESSS